jgi:glutamyl-tRNA reductase
MFKFKKRLSNKQRLGATEVNITLLEGDIESLRTDNDHLRERLDQAQEADYLLEGDVEDLQMWHCDLRHEQAIERVRKPFLDSKYATFEEYLASFKGDREKMARALANFNSMVDKIKNMEV